MGIANSSKGKRDRPEVFEKFVFKDEYIEYYQNLIENFPVYKHTPIQIYDGISRKKRKIIVPSYDEQVIHHCLVNELKPIIFNSLYEYSCGSLPNRGAHKGKKYLEKKIRFDKYNTKYCLKMDIKKFFDSIDHAILKRKLKEFIHDKKFLKVLFNVIDVTEQGLPLGFYTSQWLANWLLSDLDHYIKEKLGAVYYVRYMDDMVIFGHDKTELHNMRILINEYLKNNLGLELKSNWQVFLFDNGKFKKFRHGRPLDFMGFKFYSYNTTLRKSILLKAWRKARRMGKKNKVTVYECKQILSYLGWINCTDIYGYYTKKIKPYINFKYCRSRVSKYDKRLAKWRNKEYEIRIQNLFIKRRAGDFRQCLIF